MGRIQTSLKCHMVVKHSEKVTTYQYSRCPTTCNRLDNIRCHIKKTPWTDKHSKTVMYEIKHISPEPQPKRWIPTPKTTTPVLTRPYFNQPTSSNDYINQQSLRPNQKPITWRLIPIDVPAKTTRNKEVPSNPNDPQLTLQDLEEMNKQLLAECEVSSSDSSPDSTSIQDLEDLQDHPEDWLIRWTIKGVIFSLEQLFIL